MIDTTTDISLGFLSTFFQSDSRRVLLTDSKKKPIYWSEGFRDFVPISDKSAKINWDDLSGLFAERILNSDNFEVRLSQIYIGKEDTHFRVRLKDNRVVEILMEWHRISEEEQACLWSIYDVSEEDGKFKYLQNLKDRYEAIIRGGKDGVWDWDLESGFFYISPCWEERLGLAGSNDSDNGRSPKGVEFILQCVPMDEHSSVRKKFEMFIERDEDTLEIELPFHTQASGLLWVRMRGLCVRDEHGRVVRLSGSITNITKYKTSKARRFFENSHDTLTGLPTFSFFEKRLSGLSKKENPLEIGEPNFDVKENYSSVLLINFDRLSVINESLGRSYGDRILLDICQKLRPLLSFGETLARIAGSRFAIIMRNESGRRTETVNLVKKMQRVLGEAVEFDGRYILHGLRIGATLVENGKVKDANKIIQVCEKALREAKEKHQYFVVLQKEHAPSISNGVDDVIRFDDVIQSTLVNNEFTLHFQPIINLVTGKVEKCEALLRFTEDKGLNIFQVISAAEKSRQIFKIGQFVLEEACFYSKELSDNGFSDCRIKINISPYELLNADFSKNVERIFTKMSVESNCFGIEITEGVFAKRCTELYNNLAHLQEMGVQISLDDFGTGYASFTSLKDLPINEIKIDRSFMMRVLDSEKEGALVAAIIVLGHSLNMDVVAEGIETYDQLEFLKAFECNYAQGFLLSRPLPGPEYISYLKGKKCTALLS